MKVGVPKEIKTNENRIALVPAGADPATPVADEPAIDWASLIDLDGESPYRS